MLFPDEGIAQEVLSIPDSKWDATVVDFGNMMPADSSAQDWFWNFRGKLLVLATPFREGRHYAKRPREFLPIVRHLEWLHSKDCVHGDIRAFNMVFNHSEGDAIDSQTPPTSFNPSKGCLIDFDFGGKCDVDTPVLYPRGYKSSLDDGRRRGMAGRKISKYDDWYALGKVIFVLHEIDMPDGVTNIFKLKELALKGISTESDDMSEAIARLKAYLVKADGVGAQVTRGRIFKNCFPSENDHAVPDSGRATGSPPKAWK